MAPPTPEERLRLAQLAGGIGAFELDLRAGEWHWSPQVAVLFGFAPAEPQPPVEAWERRVFGDDLLKLRATIEEVERTGTWYVEFRVRHADGRMHWLAGKGAAAADESGAPRWLCGVFYDISDRKGLEARLLALNETLEARVVEVREEARTLEILNRTGAALAGELTLERLAQTVTDAAVELTGAQFGAFFHNLEDDQGQSYTLYTLAGAPREAFAAFPMPRNTAVFGPTFRGEGIVRSDDILADPRYGQSAPYHGMPPGHLPVRSYLALPVVSRSGAVIGGLFFGHAQPGMFTARSERIVAGVAAQAAIAFDNARLFEAGQREIEARRLAEEQLQKINETLEERVAQEVARRQQVEETLRQAQKMEAIGQLSGGIAHDFNNLLTVISGNLEHAQMKLPAHHDVQRMLAAAARGASRAALLTQRLLVFSRRQPLAPQVVALNRLVAGMSDLLRRTIGEAVSIETVLASGLWVASLDVNQLENALINLAVNARDAMPQGGKLTIETANCYLDEAYASAEGDISPGQYVALFVSDTGGGMPDDVAAKAFEPFFTTKEIGHGTGLGLSQVYGFAKQSGGHVKIYSEPGEGTTVKLYFPRHHAAEAPPEPRAAPLVAPRGRPGETVLVVDDDPDVRSFTMEMVRNLGYEVLAAEDGAAALRLIDAHLDTTLLFTDVGLPGGMNGRQLADEAVRRHPTLRVLFTTGYARNAIVHHGRLDPNVEVVFKPYRLVELATKIRRVLDS